MITRPPPAAYAPLKSAFQSAMLWYTRFEASTLLDTCYDFSNVGTVRYPIIKLHYTGVDITLGTAGVFISLGSSRYCLAFAGNIAPTGWVSSGTFSRRHLKWSTISVRGGWGSLPALVPNFSLNIDFAFSNRNKTSSALGATPCSSSDSNQTTRTIFLFRDLDENPEWCLLFLLLCFE